MGRATLLFGYHLLLSAGLRAATSFGGISMRFIPRVLPCKASRAQLQVLDQQHWSHNGRKFGASR